MPTRPTGLRIPTPKEMGEKLKGLINQGIPKVPDNVNLENLQKVAEIIGVKENIPFDPTKISSKIPGILEKVPAYKDIKSFIEKEAQLGDDREDKTRSPSTAGRDRGSLRPEADAEEYIEISRQIDEVARKLPNGGIRHLETAVDVFERVGAVNNTNPAVKVNPKGALSLARLVHGDNGVIPRYDATSLVGYTGNDNFPCGNYTISCGNKFDVTTGTGGISFQTPGIATFHGVATSIRGLHKVDIGTSGGMSIEAGQALNISAKSLSLNQSDGGQVAIGGSMGVENQLVVGGSASINGELYCQHITGPASMQLTEQTAEVNGWTNPGEAVAYIPEGRTIGRLTPELCRLICQLGGADTPGELGPADQYVKVPAFNDENPFKLGVPPDYEYNDNDDLFVETEKTGHKNNERKESVLGDFPPAELEGKANLWAGNGSGAVPVQGSGRVTSVTIEAHDHQFKNIAMSLRSSPSDVTKEAGQLDKFAQAQGIPKGSTAGKIILKKAGESPNAALIIAHLQSVQDRINKSLVG